MSEMSEIQPRGAGAGPAHLFLPRRFQRGKWLRWLKRTHAWLALWGGVAGLLFGLTGFLLNHREIMKIPAVESQPVSLQVALDGFKPESPQSLGAWLQQRLQLPSPPVRTNRKVAAPVPWGNGEIVQPERWEVIFASPTTQINAEYWQGNAQVGIQRRQGNAFYWLTRLHMAVGVHPGWVLLADAVAGCLVMLTLTGILLWTRLHGPRLLALGLATGSIAALAAFALIS